MRRTLLRLHGLAGTQGAVGHLKKDRLFELIEKMKLPTIFAEGGGGRPATPISRSSRPWCEGLRTLGRALGLVPRVAIVKGPLLRRQCGDRGCADLIVATEDSSLGIWAARR